MLIRPEEGPDALIAGGPRARRRSTVASRCVFVGIPLGLPDDQWCSFTRPASYFSAMLLICAAIWLPSESLRVSHDIRVM
jgi:hypothetical protein